MKNNILFLSLTLLFTLPVYAEHPVDPTDWGSDSMDDDFDPHTKSAVKELYNAARSRLSSPQTTTSSSPTPSNQTNSMDPHTKKPRTLQSRKVTKERETKKARDKKIKEEGAREECIKNLERFLQDAGSRLDNDQYALKQQENAKVNNRLWQAGMTTMIIGTGIIATHETSELSSLEAVSIIGAGLCVIAWNEASAWRHSEHINELKETIENNRKDKEETEAKLNDLKASA